ncbi:MAG: type II toxin-antitoxin system Phd/YefM family antitoxin [Spirochaetes bacterium]|nr:type II toxin-antitoxin system Phd/YefM family antitoxin [Spirochaetota bacterium]
MLYIKYTDFKNKSKDYIDRVEEGQDFIIIRKGKPVARLMPIDINKSHRWKPNIKKISLKTKTTLDYIQEERNS